MNFLGSHNISFFVIFTLFFRSPSFPLIEILFRLKYQGFLRMLKQAEINCSPIKTHVSNNASTVLASMIYFTFILNLFTIMAKPIELYV